MKLESYRPVSLASVVDVREVRVRSKRRKVKNEIGEL